ncbi:MAG: DUF362 domain-containing protein [Bacteroidota bacterium]
MKRRDFILKSANAGIITGAALSLGNYNNVFGSPAKNPSLPYDLVAVKGEDPALMFDKAIESVGGMSKFVKAGQTVVVKPNIGWDATPERAANTNPDLVKSIVEHCVSAGAKDVYVFDNTCNEWTKCYKNSGIEAAVKEAGGKIVTGNTESHYREVTIPGAKVLKTAKVHRLIIDTDVFINVPVLKNHGGAILTMALKNMMGVVWDRRFWHANDLNQCIADFCLFRKPDLNIIDAYRVMKRNGPRGVSVNDVVMMNSLILSPDIVAIDAAGTKLFGKEVAEIPYIEMAENHGLGTKNLEGLKIKRLMA